ncbi:MAG: hypothetical protein H6810_03620 [Phycisphaeraceae bacterium]|nr:MAG: hypothetical protein H6810_03620 [Phycisphaeraceae bacterium]
MPDLRSPRLMLLKAALFIAIGLISCTLILLDHPSLKLAALLALAIWAFCRAYYFAFYVIERYIDPVYRFAGLMSAVRYLASSRARRARHDSDEPRAPARGARW